jgi:uncharacterized membrane protein
MLIKNAFVAIRAGQVIANKENWKNRTVIVNAVAAIIVSAVGVASGFGVAVPIDGPIAEMISGVVVSLVFAFNGWSTLATSETVGIDKPTTPLTPVTPSQEKTTFTEGP